MVFKLSSATDRLSIIDLATMCIGINNQLAKHISVFLC